MFQLDSKFFLAVSHKILYIDVEFSRKFDFVTRFPCSILNTSQFFNSTITFIVLLLQVEYSIESVASEGDLSTEEEDAAAFRMDQKTGILSTRSQLDREKVSRYTVIVLASDQASPITDRRTARLVDSFFSLNILISLL